MTQDYLALVSDLQNQLKILQTAISSQKESAPAIAKDWLRSHREIQIFFQSSLVNTDLEITPQDLSLQVEIDKQLKMLGVDLTMLQTSRSPATWQKRYQQACDRFFLLDSYFQMHYGDLHKI
ncbi:hypothetical protein APA_5219 [Pseudanabaena sp. lw0831]|uniref:heterocyst frequency control protein PatD n=1 Tax=Pseudanabaena sp. lw0831 TaxID=1357935 RepID=UPI001916290C|nr:heterocyst frequency control protein PatD [Pseudanabaena sp. lw0831]GBO56884.1 hypothetical protein APA_5219 [Pseudanabaena sp. lw0831]